VEMNLNKGKRMEKEEVKEEKMEKEEENITEEENINEEQKTKVKKQCMSLYNKFKRKKENDEDSRECKIYKKRNIP
jgi:hypothetical protein